MSPGKGNKPVEMYLSHWLEVYPKATHVCAVLSLSGPCRMDDILIGAPLFMEREFESSPREVGQVYLYLQESALVFRDPQVLAGTEVFGRFGSAVAHLGDLNQDGYNGNLHHCTEITYVH